MIIPASDRGNSATDRMSIMTTDTAVTARSMRESIMSLYGHQSYYQIILDPREGNFDMAQEMLVDQSRISMIIEDHLHANTSQALNLSGHGERESSIEEPVSVGEDSRNLRFFDNEVHGFEGTENIWDKVFKHRENKRSTPSEGSIASESTVLTRASNLIQIAFIPGVTKRPVNLTLPPIPPPPQPSIQPLPPPSIPAILNKPLPSLPNHVLTMSPFTSVYENFIKEPDAYKAAYQM